MVTIGTANTESAKKVLLLGAGELGKELAISLMRLGVEVIAVDSYANAPAMQVAHRAHVCNMLDGKALKTIIQQEAPDLIVPEIEAIATDTLLELEEEGSQVVPNAKATFTTMHRERIRKLAAEELQLPTSKYFFADSLSECQMQIEKVGYPCVMKPVMSSSGKGQKTIKCYDDIETAWEHAQTEGRAGKGRVIVEEWLDFDEEITLLTVRHHGGTRFCAPIGHFQKEGDYQCSWQPHHLPTHVLGKAESIAKQITDSLGGYGIFGVELFIQGEEVIFSEVSPRPHDTGMVTLISQHLSEFDCHARAMLGLPIPPIRSFGPAASHVITAIGTSENVSYGNIDKALASQDTDIRFFGKPDVSGKRRMAVALALGESVADAKAKATKAAKSIELKLD